MATERGSQADQQTNTDTEKDRGEIEKGTCVHARAGDEMGGSGRQTDVKIKVEREQDLDALGFLSPCGLNM